MFYTQSEVCVLHRVRSPCFILTGWCLIRHLNPQNKNPQRIKKSDKEYINKSDYSSIEFPVTVKQISKIENQNSININVFGYEKMQLYPIYISKEKNDEMNLLLITEQKKPITMEKQQKRIRRREYRRIVG